MFEVPLVLGDWDWDGVANESDFTAAVSELGRCAADPEFKPWFDADLDGCITVEDMRLLLPNDSDGDGLADYQEHRAGTDPFASGSAFRIADVRRESDGGVTLRWPAVAGKVYTVFRTTDASWNQFSILSDNIAATVPTNSFTDPAASTAVRYFYRVGTQ